MATIRVLLTFLVTLLFLGGCEKIAFGPKFRSAFPDDVLFTIQYENGKRSDVIFTQCRTIFLGNLRLSPYTFLTPDDFAFFEMISGSFLLLKWA